MSLQLSVAVRNACESAIWTTINAAGGSAKLLLYTGSVPVNCAASATGTLLGTLTLPTTEENAPSGGVATIASQWSGAISYAGGGTVGYCRIVDSAGTVHMQFVVSQAATAWAASTAYVVNQVVSNGGNVYKCTAAGTSASSGGPTGTGSSIADGTVTWAYQSAVGDITVDNPNVVQNQTFNVNTFTLTEGNA